METYVCQIMNGARLRAFGIECADDADALARATAILNSQPSNRTVEIWRQGRCVGRVENNCTDLPSESDTYANSR